MIESLYQPHKNPYRFYNLVCLLVGRCTIKVEVCEIKSLSPEKDFKSSVSLVVMGSVTITYYIITKLVQHGDTL